MSEDTEIQQRVKDLERLIYGKDRGDFFEEENGGVNQSDINPERQIFSSTQDGDVWREDNTNTGLKIRINGVTKTISVQ